MSPLLLEVILQSFQIIPMTQDHIESYALALGSVARERIYIGFLEAPGLEWVRQFVNNALASGWVYYIAVVDERVVGWCNIGKHNRPIFEHSGVLGMGVVADYRGQGIGKALIRAALTKAKEKGLTRVSLTLREPNKRAIALYDAFGFVREGVHKRAICVDGVYEDQISMALLFD
ncbi:MAG TPA: GNAT family N-acetyltransferase [Gammaproteobacteria bacterium]|nr:GNAT family N-acetyltransferase [Gammaproteobacteria bacterium]